MSAVHINLSMLRVLDALAEEPSFTRAAERIGMTQSGISHGLRGLEAAVGAPLVVRKRAGIEFTEAGRIALCEARRALAAVASLERMNGRMPVSGAVRIALVASAASRLAPAALRALRRDHPLIEPELLEGTDDEVQSWVQEGLADLGVTGEPGGCASEPLLRDELLLVTPEGHPLLRDEAVGLEALKGRSFVMSGSGCEPMIRRLMRKSGVTVDLRLRVRDTLALLAMVRTGLGVSLVPELALPPAAGETVGVRRLHPPLFRELHLICRDGGRSAAAEAARRAFREPGAALDGADGRKRRRAGAAPSRDGLPDARAED